MTVTTDELDTVYVGLSPTATADVRVAEPTNAQQTADRVWMPGTEIGQVPDTPLNPVLYYSS